MSSFFIFSFDITDSRTKNSLQDSFLSCLLFFPSQEPQTKRPLLFAFDLKKQGEKSETAYFYPYFARSRTHTGAKTCIMPDYQGKGLQAPCGRYCTVKEGYPFFIMLILYYSFLATSKSSPKNVFSLKKQAPPARMPFFPWFPAPVGAKRPLCDDLPGERAASSLGALWRLYCIGSDFHCPYLKNFGYSYIKISSLSLFFGWAQVISNTLAIIILRW